MLILNFRRKDDLERFSGSSPNCSCHSALLLPLPSLRESYE